MLLVITVALVTLAALNAILTAWATVLDTRQASALMRALGANSRQVSSGLAAAQVLSALPGAILGGALGVGLLKVAAGSWPAVPASTLAGRHGAGHPARGGSAHHCHGRHRRPPARRRVVPGSKVQILRRTMQDLMGPERIPSGQQQAVPFEDGQTIQQRPEVSRRQTVQAHREDGVLSCRSHSRRACGPSSRRNRGHMLTSDSRCTNRSRSSRCASARSNAYRTSR